MSTLRDLAYQQGQQQAKDDFASIAIIRLGPEMAYECLLTAIKGNIANRGRDAVIERLKTQLTSIAYGLRIHPDMLEAFVEGYLATILEHVDRPSSP